MARIPRTKFPPLNWRMADETLSPIVRPPVTFLPLLLPEFLPSGCASFRKTALSCHAQFSEAMRGPPGRNRRTVTSLVIEGEEPIGIGKGYSGLRHSSYDFGAAAGAGRFNTSGQSGGGAVWPARMPTQKNPLDRVCPLGQYSNHAKYKYIKWPRCLGHFPSPCRQLHQRRGP